MKFLIIGGGGREHALAWKIAKSNLVSKIYCAPGNAGTHFERKCENVNLDIDNIDGLADFAEEKDIDITVVGPELPLVNGIVDKFEKMGLKIFGPDSNSARLEGSKIFSKNFMEKYGVKTAQFKEFYSFGDAEKYIKNCKYPVVIKADGLASGKGVEICNNYNEAENTIINFMENDTLKGSGLKIVIEEFLDGVEASILAITDGETMIPFITAMDHKKIYDGDKGPNTGGMGAIAPNSFCTSEVMDKFYTDIMYPTFEGMKHENINYKGILYFGIMITIKGIYLLEYNVRFGDPETQALLPLMKTDLASLIDDTVNKKLNHTKIIWYKKYSCCVMASSAGYPKKYETGFKIEGIDKAACKTFISGAVMDKNNEDILTSGGRVLAVQGSGKSIDEARLKIYKDLKIIKFKGIFYRNDIGLHSCNADKTE